ncbi:hypothetical protein FZC79_11340 [Rossellomorea vietnamensis]|uniref:Uncharacterized protein n=1 Tax=Rossellomorea vietnamensis TaxID=218284 RepID=A0A5D4KDE3_9BACI|nr:CBO0543 family protein [Rossellomorea vietnamensis]TYR75348.1 hypothetical protein FZC79_11340 [Rossellomorea vietnamensis]
MHTLLFFSFLLAVIKWGDWKNWRDYYPTFLFFLVGDLLYQYLLYNKSMWLFQPSFDRSYLPNHTVISLIKMIIRYWATTLIFLGRLPQNKSKRIFWIGLWVLIYFGIEVIAFEAGMITHHNGWNLLWSFYLDIVIFVVLSIHYKNPPLAWFLSLLNLIFLWNVFGLTIDILK